MDKQFTPRYVPMTPVNLAQRLAVLQPLMGDCYTRTLCELKTVELQALWRSRLHQLRRCGCPWLQDDKKNTYARNCPPAFIVSNQQTHCCFKNDICPFCYARSVGKLFNIIANSVFTLDSSNHELISRVKHHPVVLPIESDLKVVAANQKNDWHGIVSELNASGAYFDINFAPTDVNTEPGFITQTRYLLMVKEGFTLPRWLKGQCSVSFAHTHERLAEIVSDICKYPINMLHSDPSLTCDLLQKRNGLHLSSSFGVFRKQ